MAVNIFYNNQNIGQINWTNHNFNVDVTQWPVVQNGHRCYINNFQITNTPPQNINSVVRVAIIVESPGRNEFNYAFQPIRALNGASGIRFDRYICQNLQNLIRGNTSFGSSYYEIYIFNPVRYQCNCYHFLNNLIPNQTGNMITLGNSQKRTLTNNMWRALFGHPNGPQERNNFVNDLIAYRPNLVINCCTGGRNQYYHNQLIQLTNNMPITSGNGLKGFVRNEIFRFNLNYYYAELYHPCVW